MEQIIQKSYLDIIAFNNAAIQYIESIKKVGESKLTHVLRRALKDVERHITEYNDAMLDIRLDHCSVNDKGVITKDNNGNLEFTKDAQKEVNKAIRVLGDRKVDITPRMSKAAIEIIHKLDYDIKMAFEGFVYPEMKEDTEE